ncbi:conserved hypothetical protein [Frankia canadensis]|uniref:Uncharacterized protein n=1 Tax=Frankia canadensis TaxID=1836972 RepID=A0A2I2L2L0_9ACTN|nr:DUF5947 family protein [Frankia canadensis]SNQ52149.1 conserved hypothetical protein [Frankia canadensis]SOU59439.1 conserved hypothetical protein [Frankia canadensis]
MTIDLDRLARPEPPGGLPDGALRRLLRTAAEAGRREDTPRCDLCGAPMQADHRHLLDESRDELMCLCRACGLLFDRDAAARGHYRLVPRRRLRVNELAGRGDEPGEHPCNPSELGIPVGLAFVVLETDGEPRARCPSPLGATRWELTPAAWHRLVAHAPVLAGLVPRVEALLSNTARGRRECWIAPIDDCYRLVAIVRGEWSGLSGGSRVWPAVDAFFAGLARDPRAAPSRVRAGPA